MWHYNNFHPLLLGLVLECATEMLVSRYMATVLWQPLGAERDATRNLDSERSGFERMESTDPAEEYQYFWWIGTERPGRFYALGNYGQYICVAPDADTVIVLSRPRLGRRESDLAGDVP